MKNENDLKKYALEYLKTYLSINSFVGCPIGCTYCFLSPLGISPLEPVKVIEESKLVRDLKSSKYFVPHQTVLSLNNRTDPFLPGPVKESTFKILELLNNEGFRNPITVTTKLYLSKEDINKLNLLLNLNLFIIVTYNGLPKKIEPINHNLQIKTMKNIYKYGKKIHLFHQFRPIIEDYNDSIDKIKKVLSEVYKCADCTIFAGLRLSEFINERFVEKQINLKMQLSPEHKYIPEQFVGDIMNFCSENFPNYPIFRHTSCALSWISRLPDFNAHWTKNQCENCLNKLNCLINIKIPSETKVLKLLKKLNLTNEFKINEGGIEIKRELTQEERSFLRHNLRFPVKSEKLKKTPSEQIMTK
jgi:DNA repair photolyase